MLTDNNTIMIADSKGVSVIDINSIVRIEAVNNYSRLFLRNGKIVLVSKVLKRMEALLAGKGFERIHRSHLVNAACISRYNLFQKKITLQNEEEISISRRKRKDIRRRLSENRPVYYTPQKMLTPA
ncbi:MAG: LytR/AlgR family response regulator transcription factor [Chitinophagales bacterium]